VKSRRAASLGASAYVTSSGRRLSEYAPSVRNVATSIVRDRRRTSITPNAAPTSLARGNAPRTSSGRASVATS